MGSLEVLLQRLRNRRIASAPHTRGSASGGQDACHWKAVACWLWCAPRRRPSCWSLTARDHPATEVESKALATRRSAQPSSISQPLRKELPHSVREFHSPALSRLADDLARRYSRIDLPSVPARVWPGFSRAPARPSA